MFESLFAGAILLAFNSPQQAIIPTIPATLFVVDPYVAKVDCERGSGSGFRLESGQWVSANHVTSLGACSVDGVPIAVTYADPRKDYSLFTLPGDKRRGGLRLDCTGYHDKQWYYGEGAAMGNPILTALPVMGVYIQGYEHPRDWAALFYNRFIPGMSGGAVRNAMTGAVTGVVNAYAIEYRMSFSIPLSDTILCPHF